MTSKDFTSRLKKAAADKPESIASSSENCSTAAVSHKKVGRPKVKTEKQKIINIAVPESVMEKVEIAKAVKGGNLTAYINKLIIDDLAENFDEYQTIYNTLNKFKN